MLVTASGHVLLCELTPRCEQELEQNLTESERTSAEQRKDIAGYIGYRFRVWGLGNIGDRRAWVVCIIASGTIQRAFVTGME